MGTWTLGAEGLHLATRPLLDDGVTKRPFIGVAARKWHFGVIWK